MRKKILFYCAGLIFYFSAHAIPTNLQKSNIIVLNGSVYYFGFLDGGKNLEFRCLRYNAELTALDSFSINLGTGKAENFHEIGVDTLNRFLNFCFQKVEKSTRGIYLRLTTKLKQIYFNEDAELTRVNTQFIYDDDVIYYKNKVFVIRSPSDSAQKFFLSCYQLKSDNSFFDYELKWGFRFYKFNYLRCKILMTDEEKVLVYVHALDGEKKGQYILSISSLTGELLKSAQFNDDKATQQFSYFYSAHTFNSSTNEYFAGGIITKAGEEKDLLLPKKSPVLFMIVLDEKAEVKYRMNDVAVLPPQALKTKDLKFLTIRIKEMNISENGLVQVISEVCGSMDGKRFRPYGYWLVSFTYLGGTKNLLVNEYFDLIGQKENKLITKAPADINGIVQIKNATEYDKTLYMKHSNEILIKAKAENKELKMLVIKKELNNKKIIYSELSYKDGKMKLERLYDATFDEMPVCGAIDLNNAIIFSKSIKEGLIFKKVTW